MAESVINIHFPSQVVSDLEKMSYDYGLKVAKAIQHEWYGKTYGANNRFKLCTTYLDYSLYKFDTKLSFRASVSA